MGKVKTVDFSETIAASDLRGSRNQNQNQNQNTLLVKRQNDNTSPGDWPRKISP